jgi:hypothetical protein
MARCDETTGAVNRVDPYTRSPMQKMNDCMSMLSRGFRSLDQLFEKRRMGVMSSLRGSMFGGRMGVISSLRGSMFGTVPTKVIDPKTLRSIQITAYNRGSKT